MGKAIIDDVVELDTKREEKHLVESEKLENMKVPSNQKEGHELKKGKGKEGEITVTNMLKLPLIFLYRLQKKADSTKFSSSWPC